MARRHHVNANWPRARGERIVIFFLCALAALRVLIFSAAFPFFNNVDERRHFDLVIKYASGHFPRGPELISPATLPYLSHYASPEFLAAPESFAGGYYGPMWTHSAEEIAPTVAAIEEIWGRTPNQECSQPPLYYLLAGVWINLGQSISLKDGTLLYWTRFLNVVLIAALVWLAYLAARKVFPEQIRMRLGVPLFVAFVPQDVFYGIDNDVLSPICCGVMFICLIHWFRQDRHMGLGIVTGLSIAAAYLTKPSNLPVIFVAIGAIACGCYFDLRSGKLRNAIPALIGLVCSAAIPIAAWIIWTKINFGDFTGGATKAQLLGWTAKPFSQWWPHPIFTAAGSWTFFSELIASFWRGEFMWHAQTIGSKALDLFYVFSSAIFFAIAIIALLRTRSDRPDAAQLGALWICVLSVIAAIAFLALLSLQFDFGKCINPSRARPYFFQGRLMLGALIPFALVYIYGLDRLLHRSPVLVLPALTLILVVVMTADAFANRVAFSSAYNWFHM
jgi:hypothetical protein